MSRILLADDSPHAQRMGERILREEGFEVVTVTDGQTAMIRLADVDPDVVFADVSLPGKSGYQICEEIKADSRLRHVRVVLTAGLLEDFDEARSVEVKSDGVLKKPFEASVVLGMIKPMVEAARQERPGDEANGVQEEIAGAETIELQPGAPPPPLRAAEVPPVHSVAEAVRARFALEQMPRPVAPQAPQPERTGFGAVPVRVVSPPAHFQEPSGKIDPERVRAAVTLALDAALPAMIDQITEQVLIALGD